MKVKESQLLRLSVTGSLNLFCLCGISLSSKVICCCSIIYRSFYPASVRQLFNTDSQSSNTLYIHLYESLSNRLGLKSVFDEVIEVDVMDSGDRLHLALLGRPELGVTFTKIHCWTLTQYSKCVFLDADTLVSELISIMYRHM